MVFGITEAAAVACSTLGYAAGYAALRCGGALPPGAAGAKRRAWVITFANAVVCVLAALPVTYRMLTGAWKEWRGGGRFYWVTMQQDEVETGFARAASTSFVGAMVADLLVGVVDYRAHLDPLTAYFHHTIYVYIHAQILRMRCAAGFQCFFIEELPTVVLAYGRLTGQRFDLLYGSTFFLLRILFQSWAMICIVTFPSFREALRCEDFMWVLLLSLGLHIYWFRGWVISYLKYLKKLRTASGREEPAVGRPAASGDAFKPKQS